MIRFRSRGSFNNTEAFLKKMDEFAIEDLLEFYGRIGVSALSSATPIESGTTAESWDYLIDKKPDSVSITWTNSNITESGIPVAILLQYGHGTRTGGYVQGNDYINPAIRPIFDEISEELWKVVEDA